MAMATSQCFRALVRHAIGASAAGRPVASRATRPVSSGGTLRYHDRGFHRINPQQPRRHHPWCRGARHLATSAAGYEERITSTDNATVKHFAKLVRNRGYREECGSIVVAGSGILSEVCGGGGGDAVGSARVLFLADDACVPAGVTASRIVRAPEHVLKKAAGLQSVDRVDAVAELSMPPVAGVAALEGAGRITRLLALDGIQDPGNLGTLVRTALALGWDAVALLPGTCDPYNDKVRKSDPGDIFSRADSAAAPPRRTVSSPVVVAVVVVVAAAARFVTLFGWTPRRPIASSVLYVHLTCDTKPSESVAERASAPLVTPSRWPKKTCPRAQFFPSALRNPRRFRLR